jgi:hypothetical protein
MSRKLANPILLKCLERLARATDDMPLALYANEAARGFYLKIATPVLNTFLGHGRSNALVQLLPRHSVVERGAFNVFLSDVDYTLVVTPSASDGEISALIERYHRLARYLWFLGEIEIYSAEEQAALEETREFDPFTIDFVWRLRKLRWQLNAYAEATSGYHRFKAGRVIRRLLVQLGVDAKVDPMAITASDIALAINRSSTHWLPEGLEARPLSGRSNYIEWPLENVSAGFVAILPHGEEIADGLRDEVCRLRQNPQIGERLSRLALIELLLCRSARRLAPGRDTWAWERYLNDLIKQYAKPKKAKAHL